MRLSISAFTLMMVLASPGAARAQSAYSAEYMLSSCRPIVVERNVTEQGVSFPQSFETGFCWGAFSDLAASAWNGSCPLCGGAAVQADRCRT